MQDKRWCVYFNLLRAIEGGLFLLKYIFCLLHRYNFLGSSWYYLLIKLDWKYLILKIILPLKFIYCAGENASAKSKYQGSRFQIEIKNYKNLLKNYRIFEFFRRYNRKSSVFAKNSNKIESFEILLQFLHKIKR